LVSKAQPPPTLPPPLPPPPASHANSANLITNLATATLVANYPPLAHRLARDAIVVADACASPNAQSSVIAATKSQVS
jgi:hypothetical protein